MCFYRKLNKELKKKCKSYSECTTCMSSRVCRWVTTMYKDSYIVKSQIMMRKISDILENDQKKKKEEKYLFFTKILFFVLRKMLYLIIPSSLPRNWNEIVLPWGNMYIHEDTTAIHTREIYIQTQYKYHSMFNKSTT